MSTNQPVQTLTTIHIPTPLRKFTDGQPSVDVEGDTVGDALTHLTNQFPALKQHLYNEQGALRSFINLYLGDEDIRYLDGANTPLGEHATLSIVPSIAGG